MLRGGTLSQVLKRRGQPLSEADACVVAARILLGVGNIHAAGLAHRDVKCSNLGLLRDADYGSVVCIDLGAVHSLRAHAFPTLLRLRAWPSRLSTMGIEGRHRPAASAGQESGSAWLFIGTAFVAN
jgi:serine/threonine protein kinase